MKIDVTIASSPGDPQRTDCRRNEDVTLVDGVIIALRLINRARNNTEAFHAALKDLCSDREFRHLLLYCQTRGYFDEKIMIGDSSLSDQEAMAIVHDAANLIRAKKVKGLGA